MLLQRFGANIETEQAARGDGCLAVPTGHQSKQSASTCSVEDSEDLEIAGVEPDGSTTNLVGVPWVEKADRKDRAADGESFSLIGGFSEIPDESGKHGSLDDMGDDDGERHDTATKPIGAAVHQNYGETGELRLSLDKLESPGGNSDDPDDDNDDDGGSDKNDKPTVAASNQNPSQTGESREIPGSENHAAAADVDDFDDFDDDDDDMPVKPTFSPFSALSAAAGGDHSSAANEAKNILEDKDNCMSQDVKPVAATVSTAVAAKPLSKDQSFYGDFGDEGDASDDDVDDKVDEVYKKNSATVPSTSASNSFDDVFAKNVDPQPQTLDHNSTAVEISTGSDRPKIQRSKVVQELDEVGEQEEKVTADQNFAGDQQVGKWSSSASNVLDPSQDDEDSDLEENIEILGGKAGNVLNTITSLGETKSASCNKVNGSTEAGNKVRDTAILCSRRFMRV